MSAIFTIGYRAPGAGAELAQLMAQPRMILVDIRYMANSWWSSWWCKSMLEKRYPGRYLHLRGLGNVNYREPEKGICLFAPEVPLYQLGVLLANGWSLVLLCACAAYERCHRRLVYELLREQQGK